MEKKFTLIICTLIIILNFTPTVASAEETCCFCDGEAPYTSSEIGCSVRNLLPNIHCSYIAGAGPCEEETAEEETAVVASPSSDNSYNLQVRIPGFTAGGDLATYIAAIYKFLIGFAAVLAVIMIMVGGVQWMMAGGSPERVSNAKSYITSALIGLVLALSSFILLQTINPRLVNLEMPKLKPITGLEPITGAGEQEGEEEEIKGACSCTDDCHNNKTDKECKTLCDNIYVFKAEEPCPQFSCIEENQGCADHTNDCCPGLECEGLFTKECH